MPFWIVPTHEQALWVAGVSQWVGVVLAAVLALWLGYREVRRWSWQFNWKHDPRNERVILVVQLIGVPILLVALPIAAGILGYQYGALIGFALAYAVPVIAYIGLVVTGVMLVAHHCKCTCTNDWEYDESDQASTQTPAS